MSQLDLLLKIACKKRLSSLRAQSIKTLSQFREAHRLHEMIWISPRERAYSVGAGTHGGTLCLCFVSKIVVTGDTRSTLMENGTARAQRKGRKPLRRLLKSACWPPFNMAIPLSWAERKPLFSETLPYGFWIEWLRTDMKTYPGAHGSLCRVFMRARSR